MSDRILRPALVPGLLSCIGPFAIDMYLPAMPAIGADLGTSIQAMQGTIIAHFIAFGLAQLVHGPRADRSGRKPPLYGGIAVFMLGSVLCSFAPTVEWLIAGRAIQGLAGASLGFALFTVALFALALAGVLTLWLCVVGLFLANACLGLIIPTAMVMAPDEHGDIAGLASSLGGTLQMLAGGAMIAAAGPFFDGTARPMPGTIALGGVLVLGLSRVVVARQTVAA